MDLKIAAPLISLNEPGVVERYWKELDAENTQAYRKYHRRLSSLAIRADFCLALHRFLNKLGPDLEFEPLFSREMRSDLENTQPIKQHLKKLIGRTGLRLAFPEDHNVSHTRLIYDLDYLNSYSRPPKPLLTPENDIVFLLTKQEIENFLIKEFGAQLYDDWLSHFVYGESLRSIAAYRGVSHEAVRLRIKKVVSMLKRSKIWLH